MDVHVVILAAGKGTRMKSTQPKVLHRVAGRPMIDHVMAASTTLAPQSTVVVVGHGWAAVQRELSGRPGLTFVVQEPQLGTGHALLTTEPLLAGATGTLVLLSGDAPLLTAETLQKLVASHLEAGAAATVVTAVVDDPAGYGRIVRSGQKIARIVEDKDASEDERQIDEINSGIYAFELRGLFEALRGIVSENAQREYYLPDLVSIFRGRGKAVETLCVPDANEIRGINSRSELAAVSRIVRDRKTAELMAAGVTIEDPATAYIDTEVIVGPDTIIRPGVSLEGRTTIGAGCELHSGVRIVDSRIGDRVVVLNNCLIVESTVADDVRIGPFAHLRSAADIRERARVGNFVEIKKTVLGAGSKSSHLAYLGDATIGERVNIGAGVITCNYDGVKKNQTIIKDGAFIGSDSQLIAPVTIEKDAYVGTGTTVRDDVPGGALAVSAGRQRNIEGWVAARKKKLET